MKEAMNGVVLNNVGGILFNVFITFFSQLKDVWMEQMQSEVAQDEYDRVKVEGIQMMSELI